MINSWKSFVYAVDQMRQLQKKGNLKNQSELFVRLKRLESEIDVICDEKIAEWNKQGDLFKIPGCSP
ncbi:MAG: hypothetical protein LBC31_11770 [Treponema sp.]|jgi:hypothetical protein|nr:hypothetical protein [Treponema sp.]